MQLIIDEYGTFIGKEGERFKVESKEKEDEFSAHQTEQIIITKPSTVSSDAIKLAVENNIDIVYLDHFGMPYARIYPCKLGGTTLIRRRQAEMANEALAGDLVKSIIGAKMENQMLLLKSLEKTRKNVDFSEGMHLIKKSVSRLDDLSGKPIEMRDEMLGIEGSCSANYFACLSKILPFTERQHKAKDPFNAMLNYGYGILYSETEKACILAGLDPYLGFVHSDRYGKPSMVLDFIEQFRQPMVDRAIITLFVQKQASDSDIEAAGDEVMLTKEAKKKVAEAVLSRLHTELSYKGRKLSLQKIMLEKAREFAKCVVEGSADYKPFVHRW